MAASAYVRVTTEDELLSEVRTADRSGVALLLLGAGSDRALRERFAGLVIEVATSGVEVNLDGCDADSLAFCGGVGVTAAAGESWDGLVARSVEEGWVGLAELTGIPGTVADVVGRNPLAYGTTPGATVASVRTWDRLEDRQHTFAAIDCDFAPGSSSFSVTPDEASGRYLVLAVTFLLPQGDLSGPLTQGWLTGALGIAPGRRPALGDVRRALLGTDPVHSSVDEPAG